MLTVDTKVLATGLKKNEAERLHHQRQKRSDLFPVHAVVKQYLEHYVIAARSNIAIIEGR
jgi:hypothetical protein